MSRIWTRLRLAWLALRYGARCIDVGEENLRGFELRIANARFWVTDFELRFNASDGREIRLTAMEHAASHANEPDRLGRVLRGFE